MTAEQLEELLEHIEERKTHFGLDVMPISAATVASLARRVLAAEKLVEALDRIGRCEIDQSMGLIKPGEMVKARIEGGKALAAYREASK